MTFVCTACGPDGCRLEVPEFNGELSNTTACPVFPEIEADWEPEDIAN
jgi:hypothetical protein